MDGNQAATPAAATPPAGAAVPGGPNETLAESAKSPVLVGEGSG